MAWKIFAVVILCFNIWKAIELLMSFWSLEAFEQIDLFVSPIGALGLVAYAFDLRVFSRYFWVFWTWLFGAWCLFTIGRLLYMFIPRLEAVPTWPLKLGLMFGIGLACVVVFFIWLAVYRLGRKKADGPT